jgi:hypothetical protein
MPVEHPPTTSARSRPGRPQRAASTFDAAAPLPTVERTARRLTSSEASMRTRHLVVPLILASVGFDIVVACNCDDVLGQAPAPDAVLVFQQQNAPPLDNLDIGLGTSAIGAALSARFTIENRGNADLHVADIVLGNDPVLCPVPSAGFVINEPLSVSGAPRALTVPRGGASTVEVRFTPSSGQPACVVAKVLSDDIDTPVLLARFSGQGDAPQLCADRGVVDFGTLTVGDRREEQVTLTSCGTRAFQLQGATLNARFPEPFELVTPVAAQSLDVNQTVTLTVAFDPDAPGQFASATNTGGVIDLDTDLDGAFRIELAGIATLPPSCRIQVIPSVVQFGSVGEGRSSTQTVVIRNIGELDCTFTSADVVGGPPFSRTLVDLAAGNVLGPQQFGSVTVTFAPTTVAGAQQDILRVETSDPQNPRIDVPLQGTSVEVAPCFLEPIPTALNFGNRTLRRQTEQEVRVRNVGSETCIVTDVRIDPAGTTEFGLIEPPLTQIGDQLPSFLQDLFPFGAIVPVGQETSFIVSFRPETAGPKSAAAHFTYKQQPDNPFDVITGGGPPDQSLDVPLSGIGVAPCVTVDPVQVDFGNVAQGSTADQQVRIANCGGADLVVRALPLRSGSHPDFRVQAAPTLPLTLAPGAPTTVTVRAAPTAQGTANAGELMFGVLDVLSDAGALGVNLRANTNGACAGGQGSTGIGLVCSPRTVDFGDVIVGEDLVRSVVCNNPTTDTITIAPTVAPPFSIVSAPSSVPAGGQAVIRVRFDASSTTPAQRTLTVGANDCLGQTLGVAVRGRGVDDELPACPTPEAFTPEVVWDWNGASVQNTPSSHEVWVTPLVSRLEDTTGDGFVTRDDMPRVIFTSFKESDVDVTSGLNPNSQESINDPIKANLRAVDGATGREVFTVSADNLALQSESTPAVVDLDGDGRVEIIGNKWVLLPGVETIPNGPKINGKYSRGALVAFNADGTFKWESDEWTRRSEEIEDGGAPAVGDVDGDGFAEIALGDHLYDHNGRLLWRGDGTKIGSTGHGPTSVLADVDGRPGLELVCGTRVFRADGSILWSRNDLEDGHPAVADLDGDGNNEVVVRGGTLFVLNGQTGASLTQGFIPPTRALMPATCQAQADDPNQAGNEDPCSVIPTNPSILDFDGDGRLEVFSGNEELITGYRFTGTALQEIFRADIYDGTGASGPAGFDFEGDGAQEVVYSDESNLFAYSDTGGTIYDAERGSATIFEYSTIADINLDGHAEMLVASNSAFIPAQFGGVKAYRNRGTSWAQARAVWNQHAFVEDLVGELGTPLYSSTSQAYPGYRTTRAACVP